MVVTILSGPLVTANEAPAPASVVEQAVLLLGWSRHDVPRIELTANRPPDASPLATAWVRLGETCAVPVIYVATDSHVYRDAAGGDYQALIELAGILAHERWHLQHGLDEIGAYTVQLSVMERLHANSLHLADVRKAFRRVEQQVKGLSTVSRPAPAQVPAATQVRSSDPALTVLIGKAAQGSTTFGGLIASVQGTNGIVYVEPGTCGHGVRACLKMWMQASGPNRFVRIAIDRSPADRDIEVMSAIGHELQHAIEVLREPSITDGVTMFNFLRRVAPNDNNRFETTAAVNAGQAVYDELRASTRTAR
jgi:hypothetical protein